MKIVVLTLLAVKVAGTALSFSVAPAIAAEKRDVPKRNAPPTAIVEQTSDAPNAPRPEINQPTSYDFDSYGDNRLNSNG